MVHETVQAQIKSTSLRLYGPKASPFPRLDKVWDVKIVKNGKNVKICPPFVPITFYSFARFVLPSVLGPFLKN